MLLRWRNGRGSPTTGARSIRGCAADLRVGSCPAPRARALVSGSCPMLGPHAHQPLTYATCPKTLVIGLKTGRPGRVLPPWRHVLRLAIPLANRFGPTTPKLSWRGPIPTHHCLVRAVTISSCAPSPSQAPRLFPMPLPTWTRRHLITHQPLASPLPSQCMLSRWETATGRQWPAVVASTAAPPIRAWRHVRCQTLAHWPLGLAWRSNARTSASGFASSWSDPPVVALPCSCPACSFCALCALANGTTCSCWYDNDLLW